MSVCLALAVIYSFGYSGSTSLPSSAGSDGSVFAQSVSGVADSSAPPTGFVGEQLLEPAVGNAASGKSDSLIPGREIPGASGSAGSNKADTGRASAEVGTFSTMERPARGSLISPLQFLSPSSPFGMRTSPITGEAGEFHSGQDFAAPCGTRVFSADAGVVRAAGWHPWGGGNRVEIDHGNGLVTTYNHLEGIAVEKGQRVGAGQVIATVGTTGWSTGCHLHFETILDGQHTDPSAWKLIALDGSGPVDMPSLVNFTPGMGNENEDTTAWFAYAASSSDDHDHAVAFKSPSRVDAEVAALGKRSSQNEGKSTTTSRTTLASSRPTTSPSPSPSPSTPGKATSSPSVSPSPSTSPTPTPSRPGTPSATPTPGSTPSPTPGPSTSPAPVPDPTPTPTPVPTPTPTPEPTPTPLPGLPTIPDIIPTPTPEPTQTADPAPAPEPTTTTAPATEPAPAPEPTTTTAPATQPTGEAVAPACLPIPESALDPVTGEPQLRTVLDPVTGESVVENVLDPITGKPVALDDLCTAPGAGS